MPMLALLALLVAGPAVADGPAVVAAEPTRSAGGTWRFDVTVRHADAGWGHYADRWQIATPDGTVLGERVLLHPHDDEQPFTRSLDGVTVPDGTTQVAVSAHDTVHGWGQVLMVQIPP